MWICPKCRNENEENFRFCWSCGLTRPEKQAKPEVKIPVEPPKIQAPEPPPPVKREAFKDNPKPKEARKIDDDEEDVLPMLSRVSGAEHKSSQNYEETSLEVKVFTIAVRLVGLFMIYQFLVAVPNLALMIYAALSDEAGNGTASLFSEAFVIPLAKALFYLIVGIYLIASGRILLWLLPGR